MCDVLQCTAGSASVACVFSAQIATSKLSAYSSSAIAPYVFSSGLLQSLFGSTVGLWFEQYNAQAVLNAATGELNSGFTPVAIAVATRFIDGLGTPFPTAAFASAVSSGLQNMLPAANIFDVVVCQLLFHVLVVIMYLHCRRLRCLAIRAC